MANPQTLEKVFTFTPSTHACVKAMLSKLYTLRKHNEGRPVFYAHMNEKKKL